MNDEATYQGLSPKEINYIINKVLDQNKAIIDTNKNLIETLALVPYPLISTPPRVAEDK